jgi:uncharacterized protein (DUF2267 family)
MDYEEFLTIVEQSARIGREDAERAVRATLQTLAERTARGEARDLAAQLPPEVAPWLNAGSAEAEPFDVDEFLRRVAERTDSDTDTALRLSRAVFDALSRAVTRQEWDDTVAELPRDFAPLLPRGPQVEVVSADLFWRQVADRAATDLEGAQRAANAVLETLAERIAGGEVDDLVVHLPPALHDPLKVGRAHTGGQARRMTLDEFVERAAEREGVGMDEAREHARAVLTTLREAIPDQEFLDVRVQLPDDYDVLLARR